MSISARAAVVFAIAAVAMIGLAFVAHGVYTQPDLDPSTANWLALLSPVFAGLVPTLAAIALRSMVRAKPWRLIVAAGVIAAVYFVVPLYIGLKQQQANDQQLAVAATFISWLGAAAGLAGALAAGIVVWIYSFYLNTEYGWRKARVFSTIERAVRASDGTATAVELGPDAFDAITADWGDDADRVVVSRVDGHVLGLASDRWPVTSSAPTVELKIIQSGAGDHVRLASPSS
jgi:hypothetical protein